jgi:tetratricopeptide (TPR) repeat protein
VQQPLVLFLDDAQWCDRETLEWLHYLLGKGDFGDASPARAEVLILCTTRSEEVDESHPLFLLVAALGRTGRLTEIELAPLRPDQTKEMAVQLKRGAISPQAASALFAYTEGNPLYIVETLADDGWETHLDAPPSFDSPQPLNGHNGALPAKIYATIRERLTHLSGEARQLASLAAVIGRGFDFETLRLASQVAEERAMRSLDELWRRGIVAEETGGSYDFSHDRIRDVAYAEIGPVQRPLLHRRVAQALEARHANDPDSVGGRIAHHYEEARDHPAAIHRYMRAAARAEKLYMVEQTHTYLDRALDLLDAEPETPDTISQCIECLLSKEYALRQTQGQVTEAGREVLNRAYRLATQLGDPFRLMDVLLPLRSSYGSAGDWREASAIGNRLVALAEEVGDPTYMEWANSSTATVDFYRGEFQKASRQFKRDAAESGLASYRYSLVPGARIYLANVCWLFGYPDQARSQTVDAVGTVDAYVSPCLRIQVRAQATKTLHWNDDNPGLAVTVRELGELCAAYGYVDMGFSAPFLTHWLEAEEGAALDGIAGMQNALEGYIAQMNTYKDSTYYLTVIAESQAKAGLPDAALKSLARARQISDKWGERFWLAEIHRLTGKIEQRLGRPDEAVEASFKEALKVARQQNAKSLELRAATSLACFWQEQGRRTEARSLLAEIYDWFSEGFDTPDLQAAKSLLDSLAV